jgi:hypothetical protein
MDRGLSVKRRKELENACPRDAYVLEGWPACRSNAPDAQPLIVAAGDLEGGPVDWLKLASPGLARRIPTGCKPALPKAKE